MKQLILDTLETIASMTSETTSLFGLYQPSLTSAAKKYLKEKKNSKECRNNGEK